MALRRQVTPELVSKVTKALGITALDQWYYVSHSAVAQAVGVQSLKHLGGTYGFLKAAYPNHQFDEEKLVATKRQEKDQKFLEVIIRKLFPNTDIYTKARKAVGIKNPETEAYLEIDFWIPSLKLGIEYQDRHHFEYRWYANDSLEGYQMRDKIKKATMPTLGYTLVTIGYWWDKTIESVAATIRKYRPDLLHEHTNNLAEPIPPDPPPGLISESSVIPGVAGLMSPFIPGTDFNPSNWYAGEKHDGIRGVYNPTLQKIFSRSGKELSVIEPLLNDIPKMLVEGEITAGRGHYNKTSAMSYHSHHEKVNWSMFRYVLFDIPDAELGDYTQRYSEVIRGLATRPFIFAQSALRLLLDHKPLLQILVDSVVSDAGEGIIVQQNVLYEYGRAKSLAKIKVRRDADAQVLQVNKLSCTCKLVSGVITDINFGDDFDPRIVNTGDIVSYYYQGYTQNGHPKRAEIYKVRYDLNWERLVTEEGQSDLPRKSIKDALGSKSLIARNRIKNKLGHWNKSPNVRAFFDEFARTSNFDPLVPENWYAVTTKSVQRAKGGGLFYAFDFNLKKALSYAYPELDFKAGRFRSRDKTRGRSKTGHWHKSHNVRAFFDEFARSAGFDPLVADNWYPVKTRDVDAAGGGGLLFFYNKLRKALAHAYPEVKFEESKFRTHQRAPSKNRKKYGHWSKPQNAREFFDEFARTSGFNPLVPESWYTVTGRKLRSAGGHGLLFAYNYDINKALTRAYPEVKFEGERFGVLHRRKAKKGHWQKPQNSRAFLDDFAKSSGFDPLEPENWYMVRLRALRNLRGSGLLSANGYDFHKALTSAYPELHFKKENFRIKGKPALMS